MHKMLPGYLGTCIWVINKKKISILILEVPRFSSVSLLDWHKPVYNMYYRAVPFWISVLVYVFCIVPFGIHILCVYTLKLISVHEHACMQQLKLFSLKNKQTPYLCIINSMVFGKIAEVRFVALVPIFTLMRASNLQFRTSQLLTPCLTSSSVPAAKALQL